MQPKENSCPEYNQSLCGVIPDLDIERHRESLPDGVSVEYIFHPERKEELASLQKK